MAKEADHMDPHGTPDQPSRPLNADRVSSPASTGGAGAFFEQHVAAHWLVQLLVGSIPPILCDCAVVEVSLQTEYLGWHTDDFLVVGQNGQGGIRKLAGQVKRSFTISSTDGECKKAMLDFWRDFSNPKVFTATTDRLILVTFRGTNSLLENFSGLLDCSRAASDGEDFERRLTTPGHVNAKVIKYCNVIRDIIGKDEGRSVSVAEIWPFLRVLHVLSLDLCSSTRQTEASMKTLLAHTTTEQDARGVAESSWNALLSEVGEGMARARRFRRKDLPEGLRQRHALVGEVEHRMLRALDEHSALILSGVRSTIGTNVHLRRVHLVQNILEQLESAQVVLVSGVAGSGKSVIAKDAIEVLAKDYFTFSFRADEFARPHFDETLQSSQIPANAATLGAILAGQDRKVLLVESVERLLEKPTRDAFADLLTLVAKDKSWRLVLTCRDYSADLVRDCFLRSAGVSHSVVTVPPLEDAELKEIEAAYPELSRPLASTSLRRILSNPYVLDKALQIRWPAERSLPQSEREFRSLFWREIVRDDYHVAGGMPSRREEVFEKIAIRRAQALSLYATCGDLDQEVVNALRRDSLIVSDQHNTVLVAPAHDVLEDWAILKWIEGRYLIHERSVQDLSSTIGAHPAIRRTYRKWATELVGRDPGTADSLFQAVACNEDLSAHFRDDTLVSLLRSPSSAELLERHSADLFTNNKQLLRRLIHLLRVACVTTPRWLGPAAARTLFLNVPKGPAWACILRLVKSRFQEFSKEESLLLLSFIEDWARGITWEDRCPDGADSVPTIADWLLSQFTGYGSKDLRKRTLQLIAKIPTAARERITDLLQHSCTEEVRDHMAEEFREIIFEAPDGNPAARDMPELIVTAAKDYLLCSEKDLRRRRNFTTDLELETLFGIRSGMSHNSFPASAYRGPFLMLLRHHFCEGLDFIVDVFNHSADWYAHPRAGSERVEPPYEITLTFADGTSRTQWCNARLWNLYRGTSVGPLVLQSLLMALERSLLELAEARPNDLDSVLLDILRRSDSAALTAVVASVGAAFPFASGETLLVLLRTQECILLDRHRLVNELQVTSRLSSMIPRSNVDNEIYLKERKEADARSHRRLDLETAILNLQLGPLVSRTHGILDHYRSEMPPEKKQSKGDHLWRLAIHRMDLRQYDRVDEAVEVPASTDDEAFQIDGQRYTRLEPKDIEPGLRELVRQSSSQSDSRSAQIVVFMWGISIFEYKRDTDHDPACWRQRLEEARKISVAVCDGSEHDPCGYGPGFIAAVCVRDHWKEMSEEERTWALDAVCSAVEQNGDRWDRGARVQRNTMSPDRACASVLSLLVVKSLDESQSERVQRVFVTALTHAIKEVRWYAASGIGRYLWSINRDLTLRCVNALAMEATLVQQGADAEKDVSYEERRGLEEIESEAAATVRRQFIEVDAIMADAYRKMDSTSWFGAEANGWILAILGQAPTEALAVMGFERLSKTLVEWWDADEDRNRDRQEEHQQRNHESEASLKELLQGFVLRTSNDDAVKIIRPIVDVIERHPENVRWILLGMISVEDQQSNASQFWSLWELFAEGLRKATWLEGIDDGYSSARSLVSAIFLGTWWRDDVHHWQGLDGYAERIHELFEELPPSATVLEHYVRFLYRIGEQSLPEAFLSIAKGLQRGDPQKMLGKGDTVYMLERLLQRYVYGRPLELKRQRELREAVLLLLDLLVENGSSAAFRMRDDFVTPALTT